MTPSSLHIALNTTVRLRTMTTAIVLGQRLAGELTRAHLLHIARRNVAVADALALGLSVLAAMIEEYPDIREVIAALTPPEIAAVLTVVRLSASGDRIEPATHELAEGIRLAAARHHTNNPNNQGDLNDRNT